MLFYPKMYRKSIYDINYPKLKNIGIKCLLFDLDNTIGCLDQDIASKETVKLFKKLNNDFITIIVSNNASKERVKKFAESLNCNFYHFALKPSGRILRKIKKQYNLKEQEICMIGDQLLTDILMANRNNINSCLVDPMHIKDLKITSINRRIEAKIIKRYEKEGKFKKGEYYE